MIRVARGTHSVNAGIGSAVRRVLVGTVRTHKDR